MLTSHRTRHRAARWGLATLLLAAFAAALAILAIPSRMMEATGPPPSYTLYTAVSGEGSITPSGGSYSSGTQLQLLATPASGWSFDRWEGEASGSSNPLTVTMDEDRAIVGYFNQDGYALTTSVSPPNSGSVSPSGGIYAPGSEVTLTAIPDPGYQFSHWTGDVTGVFNPIDITMDAATDACAVMLPERQLIIEIVGNGDVAFDVAPVREDAPDEYTFLETQSITIYPFSDSGYIFDRWEEAITGSDVPGELTIDSQPVRTVRVVFTPGYKLLRNWEGRGSVTADPAGDAYSPGTPVSLTATPDTDYFFHHWEKDLQGTVASQPLTMDADKTVKAYFVYGNETAGQAHLLTQTEGDGIVETVPPGEWHAIGTTVTVRAIPIGMAALDRWEGDFSGNALTQTIVMNDHKTARAVFNYNADIFIGADGPGKVLDANNVVQAIGEDFNDGDYAGWTVWSGTWSAANGYLEKTTTTSSATLSRVFTHANGEYGFSYRCTDITSPNYCYVRFRYTPADEFIQLVLRPVTTSWSKKIAGAWTSLGSASIETLQDQWYDVKVMMNGPHVEVWRGLRGDVSSLILSTDEAEPLATNWVFLGVYGNSNVHFHFDDIAVDSRQSFDTVEDIKLTPVPEPSTSFITWTGDVTDASSPAVVTTDANTELTSLFRELYMLSFVEKNGWVTFSRPQDGTEIYYDPEGPTYGYYFGEGSTITLTAGADLFFRFKQWTGDLTGSENPITVTVDRDLDVTPEFELVRENVRWIRIQHPAGFTGSFSLSPSPIKEYYWEPSPDGSYALWYCYDPGPIIPITIEYHPISGSSWFVREWKYTTGWPPGPEMSSTDSTLTVNLKNEVHVAPLLGYRLTVNIEADGAIHFGDPGTTYDTSPVVVDFPESEMVSVYAVPDANAGFVQWLGSATSATNPLSLTMDENKKLTAVFSTAFEVGDVNLNVSVLGQGEIGVNSVPVTGSERFVFDVDTQVTLTATPVQGYDFVGWGGHLTGTTTPQTLLLDSSKSVSALFIPTGTTPVPQKEVHVSIQGNGTVTPAGAVKDVDDLYPVEFTALPEYGWRFVRWELNGFDVGDINVLRLTLLDSDHLIAIFEPGYSVVALVDSERGDVFYSSTSPQLAGMFLPWSLGYRLDGSDSVTVRAVPKPGHRFSHWEGAISAATANVTFGVTENMVIEPIFIRVLPFNIFANAHGTVSAKLNGVSVPSNGDSIIWLGDEGSQVELTATPEYGYHLDRWDGTSVVEISENKAVLTLNDQSEVRAHFERDVVEFSVDVVHPEWGEVLIEPEKNEYYVGDVVQITPIQDEGCAFDGFAAEPGSDNYAVLQHLPLVARLTGDTHITASFEKQICVRFFVHGPGNVQTQPSSDSLGRIYCAASSEVTLTAVPVVNAFFVGWEGDYEASTRAISIVADEDLVILAQFGEGQNLYEWWLQFPQSATVEPTSEARYPWYSGWGDWFEEWFVDRFAPGQIVDMTLNGADESVWNRHRYSASGGIFPSRRAKLLLPNVPNLTGQGPDFCEPLTLWGDHADGYLALKVQGEGRILGAFWYPGHFIMPLDTTTVFPRRAGNLQNVWCYAVPKDGWHFAHWQLSRNEAVRYATHDHQGNVVIGFTNALPSAEAVAAFEADSPVHLTLAKSGLGTMTPQVGNHEHSAGDLVLLDAEPADGWTFDRWEYGTGALLSTYRRTGFVIQSNTTVRAVFRENPILLTHFEGNGHVLRSPEGVFYPPTPGSPPQDAVVRLDAVQHADSVFVGWSGTGIAYTDAGLTNSIPLDNPSNPADDPVIWIVMDPDLESGTRHITANFECACAIGGGGTKSTEGETDCECYTDVAVKLELEPGGFSIDPTNEYSENTTIRATVVDPNTGDILTGFGGIACIREVETDIYYPRGEMVSAMMNGAQHGFPLSLEFTASDQGTKTFVAKSVAWAVPGEPGGSLYVKPSPSKIKVTNMTDYGTTPLEILQWVDNGPIAPIDGDDPICANAAPDWFETKVRDIFAVATNDVATVFSVVQDYKYELGERSAAGWVEQRRQEFHTIYLNPYTLVDRIDKTPLSNNIYRCLGHSYVADRELRRTITHEARHAYQNNLVSRPGNDDDQDWLPEVVDVAPLNIIVDNPTPRDRCNSGNVTLSGDDTFDCYFAADPHTTPCDESVWVYQNLIEDDAEQFAEDHKDDDR